MYNIMRMKSKMNQTDNNKYQRLIDLYRLFRKKLIPYFTDVDCKSIVYLIYGLSVPQFNDILEIFDIKF